jgi:hypothetical protein
LKREGAFYFEKVLLEGARKVSFFDEMAGQEQLLLTVAGLFAFSLL